MGALDVAVVIHLDPLGGRGQGKGLRKGCQQFGLRGAFGHFARQGFARIAQRAIDQFGLFAPLRHQQRHFAPQLLAKRLFHQIAMLDRVRQQDLARRFLVVVELA